MVASILQVTRLPGVGSALGQLVEPMLRLVMSLVLGLAGGAWLAFALQPRGSSTLRARLPPKAAVRYALTSCHVPSTQIKAWLVRVRLDLERSISLRARMHHACRLRALAIITTSSTLFFGARALRAEPLLACVMAGLVAANRR